MAKAKGSRKGRGPRGLFIRWLAGIGALFALSLLTWLLLSPRNQGAAGPQPISQLSTADYHSLAFAPADAETIFFGHHGGLLVSYDGGRTWEATALQNADAMALAVPFADPQMMYAAGHDVFFKSTDGGQRWQPVSTNLPGSDIHGFTVDPGNANRVYAHVVGFGLFRSEDGGESWTQVSTNLPPSTFNLSMSESSQTLYAAAGEAGLWRGDDGGQTWTRLSNVPGSGVLALAYHAASDQLFIGALGAGLYRSVDGGQTWESLDLNGTLVAVASHPQNPDHLVVVNDKGQVYASQDGGKTWLDK